MRASRRRTASTAGAPIRIALISLVPAAARGSMVAVAREMALIRYARANLKLNAGKIFARNDEAFCQPHRLSAVDQRRLADYVEQLPLALHLAPGRVVVVFNSGSNTELYERVDRGRARPAALSVPPDNLALAELRRLAVVEADDGDRARRSARAALPRAPPRPRFQAGRQPLERHRDRAGRRRDRARASSASRSRRGGCSLGRG